MNISTYKGILLTMQKFEEDENRFRKSRFWWCVVFIASSTLVLIVYAFYRKSSHVIFPIQLIGTSLVPIFNYLLASCEKDLIDQRRSDLIEMIINNFNEDHIDIPRFSNGPIRFDDLKSIIFNIVNRKL